MSNQILKIIHIIKGRCNPESANGVDKTVFHLSSFQSKGHHNVTVINLTDKPPIQIEGVHVRSYSHKREGLQKLRSDLIHLHPDVVHLHSVYTPVNNRIASFCNQHQIPYIVTPHGGYGAKMGWWSQGAKWFFDLLYERSYLDRALFVHSVGDRSSIESKKIKSDIVDIPNGFSVDTIPHVDHLTARLKLGSHEKKILLFLGRLSVLHKGLDLLLEGLALTARKDWHLILAGPDYKNGRRALEAIIRKYKLDQMVTFYGAVAGLEKWELIAGADIHCHTSRWEGMPFSIVEAAAMGRPCLLTRGTNMFNDMDSEYLNLRPDPIEIARSIESILSASDEKLMNYGARLQMVVIQKYNWNSIAADMTREIENRIANKICGVT